MCRSPFHFLVLLAASLIAAGGICMGQTSTQVLYVQQDLSLLTYNVDPSTLQATSVGQALPLTGAAAYVQLIPSPNDHFVYVLSGPTLSQMTLSVYATDISGVPVPPAVQSFGPAGVTQFIIDPNGKFAYLTRFRTNSQGEYAYEMRLFTINATTGRLTESPKVQVTFAPSFYCAPEFAGFHPNGSEIRYSNFCTPRDIMSATYYQRSIDSQTGQLGPEKVIYAFSDSNSSSTDDVRIGYRNINDLNLQSGQTSMRIYPINSGKTPWIDCTAAMLAACGQASQFWQDIYGQYLLLSVSTGLEIVKIDWTGKRIVDTGNSIQEDPYFSPDDSILYGASYGVNTYIQIYGFDRSTGALTTGEQIAVSPTFWNVFAALQK